GSSPRRAAGRAPAHAGPGGRKRQRPVRRGVATMAESGGGTQTANGSEARKQALRAAAIAAASGATAIAAKGAVAQPSGGGSSSSSSSKNGKQASKGDSLLGGMVGSGWSAARESLVPFAADAAKAGGEYIANNGPDFVRDTIVPAFIEGFQGAGKSD